MSSLMLQGIPVTECRLEVPRTGRPVARFSLKELEGPAKGTQGIFTFTGGQQYIGNILWASQESKGWWTGVWVGGRNGIGQDRPSKFYRDLPISKVLEYLVIGAEERFAWAGKDKQLARYCAIAGPGYRQLNQAMSIIPDHVWRIRDDGVTWVGLETWPSYDTPSKRVTYDPDLRKGVWELDPKLKPGVTLKGYTRVERVVHVIGVKPSTEVYFGPG